MNFYHLSKQILEGGTVLASEALTSNEIGLLSSGSWYRHLLLCTVKRCEFSQGVDLQIHLAVVDFY